MADEPTSERLTFWQMLGACYGTRADQARNRVLTRWSLIWAASIIAASWVLTNVSLPQPAMIAIALLPAIPAIVNVLAFLDYVNKSDELLRKVQLEGLAIGFGISWVICVSYVVALAAGAPELPMVVIVLLMTAAWMFGNVFSVRRNLI